MGGVQFHDMLDFIGYSPDDAEIPSTTVGNWVWENSGGQARAGEQIVWHGLQITVSRVQKQRVMELTVSIR
jgi:CBS domain containing-hemolysin-like protein